jgi:hypothetical protein
VNLKATDNLECRMLNTISALGPSGQDKSSALLCRSGEFQVKRSPLVQEVKSCGDDWLLLVQWSSIAFPIVRRCPAERRMTVAER